MTRTYAAVFAPVRLAADEAIVRLRGPLHELAAVYTGRCYGLSADPDESGYRFDGGVRDGATASAAAAGPPAWQGVSALHMSPHGGLHVAALGILGAATTVALLPDSGWVTRHQYEPAALAQWVCALTESAASLGAAYWIYEHDPELAELSPAALQARLADLADPSARSVAAVGVLGPDGEYTVSTATWFPQIDDD